MALPAGLALDGVTIASRNRACQRKRWGMKIGQKSSNDAATMSNLLLRTNIVHAIIVAAIVLPIKPPAQPRAIGPFALSMYFLEEVPIAAEIRLELCSAN